MSESKHTKLMKSPMIWGIDDVKQKNHKYHRLLHKQILCNETTCWFNFEKKYIWNGTWIKKHD